LYEKQGAARDVLTIGEMMSLNPAHVKFGFASPFQKFRDPVAKLDFGNLRAVSAGGYSVTG
jgi:hypothetical protein